MARRGARFEARDPELFGALSSSMRERLLAHIAAQANPLDCGIDCLVGLEDFLGDLVELGLGRARTGGGGMSVAWSAERRAGALLPQRDDLLRRLVKVAPSAIGLSDDERELVIDEALTYVVMEYGSPIESALDAEEVFWTAARLRVARVLEGRGATVPRRI